MGKREGYGIYKYPNGDFYEGEWLENVQDGYGKYTWSETGATTEGLWRSGQKEGEHLHLGPKGNSK